LVAGCWSLVAVYTGFVEATRSDDDPVTIYLREIGAIPALTMDEEIELSQHVLAHDRQAELARKRVIEANLATVVSSAHDFLRRLRPELFSSCRCMY